LWHLLLLLTFRENNEPMVTASKAAKQCKVVNVSDAVQWWQHCNNCCSCAVSNDSIFTIKNWHLVVAALCCGVVGAQQPKQRS